MNHSSKHDQFDILDSMHSYSHTHSHDKNYNKNCIISRSGATADFEEGKVNDSCELKN